MSNLFIVYLGGTAPKANIELHDIQFVVGNTIEDTYSQLKSNWFGSAEWLHLDSYKKLIGADGYKISLSDKPQQIPQKLYFVNFGGYDENRLNELHEFGLFVATSKSEVKEKAKLTLLKKAQLQHKDNLMLIDDCIELSHIDGKYIHLEPSDTTYDLKPDWFGFNVIS